MSNQSQQRKYTKSDIDKIAKAPPSWETCIELYRMTRQENLGHLMGALAAAIRHGPEITHIDWGDRWIELAIKNLEGMEPLKDLAEAQRYTELDRWLAGNQSRIIANLHRLFVGQLNG